MGPGLTWKKLIIGNSSQNSPTLEHIIFWGAMPYMCILCVNMLLKVAGHYYLSVLSMSVMGFRKKYKNYAAYAKLGKTRPQALASLSDK